MTTASTQHPASAGTTVLLSAGATAMLAVAVLAVVAALVTGAAGFAGAMAGGVVGVFVFLVGSLVVNTVAGITPGLSLVFALVTYTLQVLALGLFFSALRGSDLLDRSLDATWLGTAIIVVTVAWLGVQVLLATRARIPVYDLPPRAGER